MDANPANLERKPPAPGSPMDAALRAQCRPYREDPPQSRPPSQAEAGVNLTAPAGSRNPMLAYDLQVRLSRETPARSVALLANARATAEECVRIWVETPERITIIRQEALPVTGLGDEAVAWKMSVAAGSTTTVTKHVLVRIGDLLVDVEGDPQQVDAHVRQIVDKARHVRG